MSLRAMRSPPSHRPARLRTNHPAQPMAPDSRMGRFIPLLRAMPDDAPLAHGCAWCHSPLK
jgi:hypothetical protein